MRMLTPKKAGKSEAAQAAKRGKTENTEQYTGGGRAALQSDLGFHDAPACTYCFRHWLVVAPRSTNEPFTPPCGLLPCPAVAVLRATPARVACAGPEGRHSFREPVLTRCAERGSPQRPRRIRQAVDLLYR